MKFSCCPSTLRGGLAILLLLLDNVAANTPDLCTSDIEDLRFLRPSECDPTGRVGPDIQVGSTIYNNDELHLVVGSPAAKGKKTLTVYLPGTTDWPGLSSCLIQSAAASGNPTIGLTYAYLSRGDGFRNTRCASLAKVEEQVECLTEQHNDAIYGGTYGANLVYNGAEFWKAVDPLDSIEGRLGLLLAKLDADYPDEGWDKYYKAAKGDYPALPTLKWEKIAFVGHSQGAGHAAYLAQTKKIAGAAMISGPQDECVGCPEGTKFWIDYDFKSSAVTAFAHGDASKSDLEPTLPSMIDNWNRMAISGTVSWPYPVEVIDTGDYTDYDVCETPIVSFLAPSAMSPCGRKGHCSTALDDSAPVLADTNGNNVYVFAFDIWRKVSDVSKCNKGKKAKKSLRKKSSS